MTALKKLLLFVAGGFLLWFEAVLGVHLAPARA